MDATSLITSIPFPDRFFSLLKQSISGAQEVRGKIVNRATNVRSGSVVVVVLIKPMLLLKEEGLDNGGQQNIFREGR